LAGRAVAWIAFYLALVLAPLAILIVGPMPPGKAFLWDFSMALGFAGIAMIAVQFLLTSRYKRASAPFGLDIIYLFHRYLALIAVTLVLTHFVILWFFYEDALGELDPRKARFELTLGRAALVLFLLAILTSEFRKRLRIEYGLWRYAHVILATFGFAAAVGHIVGVGYYTEAPGKRTLWLALTLVFLLTVVWMRVIKPWRQLRKPYRVVEVRPERSNTWTLALEPDGHKGLKRFQPGQFAWLTLRNSPFSLREHPFTIASPPEALPRVEFGIKELGDFTSTIGTVKPGEAVYLDAPHGMFSIDRNSDAPGFVGIVGGIGITPLMSMMRSMAERGDRRPVVLFYANKAWDGVIYRDEIESLSRRMDLTVIHVLEKPPPGWSGEEGFVDGDTLARHLPTGTLRELHYFLCGPVPMTRAAEQALRDLGVPVWRIQTEIFELV
jgi:predicted ferric reductase